MLPDKKPKAHTLSSLAQNQNYVIHVWSHWNQRAATFAKQVEGEGATLFQSEFWLSTWYQTFTGKDDIEAVIIAVEDALSGELVMLLPLCRCQEEGLAVICFADFGLADYNAPLLNSDAHFNDQMLKTLMRDICEKLPDADLLKLEKMPKHINQQPNPLNALKDLQESNLCHYGIEISDSWDVYWSALKRNFRKDQRRRWRVLEKKGEVSFVHCQNRADIVSLFETLITQQHQRLEGLGLPYLLENPDMKRFYEQLLTKGCETGPIIFTALLVDDLPVATLCGFGNGSHYAMTISGYEMGEWSKASPGRLLTERTMQTLHEQGYRYFDFTIGDEPYKKYFAKEQGTLRELCRPLSWKGLPRHSLIKTKAALRKSALASSFKNWLYRK